MSAKVATVNQYERAFRAWPILARAAKEEGKTTYGRLAAALGTHHRAIRYVLSKIQDYCLNEKLPPLTILVENQKGIVGTGFIAWDADDLETGLRKVYNFDWNGISNPFAFAADGATPEEISTALANRKASSKEIYARVRVRGIAQLIFRETMLRVYGGKCAVSGFSGGPLLQAAHILLWGKSTPAERLDPCNGILLSVLHHQLFDLDWIRIGEDYRISLNRRAISKHTLSKVEKKILSDLEGGSITLPTDSRNWPSKKLIARRYEEPTAED